MKTILFTLLSGLVLVVGQAQELGTHFLGGAWQASYTNPALLPTDRVFIQLPDLYNDIHISSVTYSDLIGKDAEGRSVLDIERAIGRLEAQNLIREQLRVGTLGVGFNLGPLALSLQHGLRYQAFLNYPKTLPQLVWQGNAQFIGQTVDASTDVELNGYHEVALGAALRLGEHLTLGGRFKWLGGIADASTPRRDLRLTTDAEAYALTLDADFQVNSSGGVTYGGFRDLTIDFDFGRFDLDRAFGDNTGYAVDLGLQFRFGKLTLNASALDIGRIRWAGEARNYRLEGTHVFAGLDVARGILQDSTRFGSILDTLETLLDVTETFDAYTTRLPRQVYLSAGYRLNDIWRVGALFYTQEFRGENFPAAALAVQARAWTFLELGATYAWRNERFDNIGLNAVFRAGPLQVVASTDNLLTAFQLRDSNSANLRLGVNLLFP